MRVQERVEEQEKKSRGTRERKREGVCRGMVEREREIEIVEVEEKKRVGERESRGTRERECVWMCVRARMRDSVCECECASSKEVVASF